MEIWIYAGLVLAALVAAFMAYAWATRSPWESVIRAMRKEMREARKRGYIEDDNGKRTTFAEIDALNKRRREGKFS